MSGNAMFSCTFMLLQSEHFPFINCVETLVYEHKYPQWESCFEKLGLDPKPISDCYSSGHGKEVGFLQLNLTLNFPFKWRKLSWWKYQDAHPFFSFFLLLLLGLLELIVLMCVVPPGCLQCALPSLILMLSY